MERSKELEQFRHWLKKSCKTHKMIMIVTVVTILLHIATFAIVLIGDNPVNYVLRIGIIIPSVMMIIHVNMYLKKEKRALQDNEALQELFIKQTDEREQHVVELSSRFAYMAIVAGLFIAISIAALFQNTVAFCTLFGVFIFVLLVFSGTKWYFQKRI